MRKDYSIIYNGKIKEINDNLKKLEDIKISIPTFKEAVENIIKETEISIENNYKLFNNADQTLDLDEANAKVYSQASKEIDKLNQQIIKEYDIYYKITMKYNKLLSLVVISLVDDVTEDNICDIVIDCRSILSLLKSSSNIDYSFEKDITEKIYQLTYKIIKLELIYSNSAGLLYALKNPTDQNYITELIKEDIKLLDENHPDTKLVKEKVNKLKENGLNNMFLLDKNLIILLAILTDKNLSHKVDSKFFNSLKNYIELEKDMHKTELAISNSKVDEIKKSLKIHNLKIFKKKVFLSVNLLLVTSSIVGSAIAIGKLTESKENKVKTTVYDSFTDTKKITERYEDLDTDTISLIEYSPWDEPGYFRDEYSRNVYTYDLEGIKKKYANIEDYLTSDLKEKIKLSEEKEEIETEKPKDLDYTKNKYIITEKVINEKDFRMVKSKIYWPLFSILSSIGIIAVDFLLLKKLTSVKLKDLKQKKKKVKKELKSDKEKCLENKKSLHELSQLATILKFDALDNYEKLPDIVKETFDIKESFKSLIKK
ncbi:MAG: hypothetical protein HFJ11_06920 [Bacilli bacterium]|nr:hypothetical protein [Bacilli bacterium]